MTKVNGPVLSHAKMMLSRPSSTLPVLEGGCRWFLVWGSRLGNVGPKVEKYSPCCELIARCNPCKVSSSMLTRLSSALELASRLIPHRTLRRCCRKKFSCLLELQLKSRRRSLEGSELLVRALVGAQEHLGGRKRGPQERSLSP